ncbi:hypothetical protein [Aeromonas sp. MrichA-1]|uniref:hypothetical protein n=1 Tax=Aeromonas sp. MrichA-1 TaxID=2823362 RepID=UPI001B3317C4|nr:hypothetical protein [Aeromonas sp. MrichA-1]MBP4081474.1 hypothetical protein [Aeromonas sp. MrichA-1]
MSETLLDERALLSELSYEISNFADDFKGKVRHTYILNPFASSLFCVNIVNERVMIGVPARIFELLIRVRWYVINVIKGKPGLFLVFEIGKDSHRHPAAIRVFLRTKQADAVSMFKEATFIKCDEKGLPFEETRENYFILPIKTETRLQWESMKIITKSIR